MNLKMIKPEKYNKNLGYMKVKCQCCKYIRHCCQHHISPGASRAMSDVIWICDNCHAKVHNPSAYGLPIDWSYTNGYLVKSFKLNYNSNGMLQKKKIKACSHSKSMYDARLDYIKCQFCGQKMDSIKYGSSKVKEVKVETTFSKAKTTFSKTETRMGYEKQDPRIQEAEKLKKQLVALKIIIKKKMGTPLELTMAAKEIKDVLQQMKELQESYT